MLPVFRVLVAFILYICHHNTVGLSLYSKLKQRQTLSVTTPKVPGDLVNVSPVKLSSRAALALHERVLHESLIIPELPGRKYEGLSSDSLIPVMIKYTGGHGYKAVVDATAMKIKQRFPDVAVRTDVVDARQARDLFSLEVDGRVVYSKRPHTLAVYLNFPMISQAVQGARRRKRMAWRRKMMDADEAVGGTNMGPMPTSELYSPE